jgi:hypothetical protein
MARQVKLSDKVRMKFKGAVAQLTSARNAEWSLSWSIQIVECGSPVGRFSIVAMSDSSHEACVDAHVENSDNCKEWKDQKPAGTEGCIVEEHIQTGCVIGQPNHQPFYMHALSMKRLRTVEVLQQRHESEMNR